MKLAHSRSGKTVPSDLGGSQNTLCGSLGQHNFRMKLQKVKLITIAYNPTSDNYINRTLRHAIEQIQRTVISECQVHVENIKAPYKSVWGGVFIWGEGRGRDQVLGVLFVCFFNYFPTANIQFIQQDL